MVAMDSIGDILRLERERRELSVQDAHDATKIAVQSIAALEEDRFESFANKVYARAFLRDYANFLSLDSVALLDAYEQKWGTSAVAEPVVSGKGGGSAWRAFGYTLLVVILVAALAGGGYYALYTYQHKRSAVGPPAMPNHTAKPEVATIPKTQPVEPPPSEPAAKPTAAPTSQPAATADKLTLEVTALQQVWVRVKVDGQTVLVKTFEKGQTQAFEGKTINIRAGMAGAVQLKLNGVVQPSLGSMKVIGDKTFTLPEAPPPTGPVVPR